MPSGGSAAAVSKEGTKSPAAAPDSSDSRRLDVLLEELANDKLFGLSDPLDLGTFPNVPLLRPHHGLMPSPMPGL